jgi:hypothetical protein
LGLGVFLAAGLTGAPAHATLGGDADSVAANERNLRGAHAVEKSDAGERHRLKLASGMIIHEYVAAGRVYAVTWRGRRTPDLRELLGPYFEQLEQHRVQRRGSHHASQSTGDDLVVQSSGHGHSFAGRAWVPSLVPSGVDAAKLSSEDAR